MEKGKMEKRKFGIQKIRTGRAKRVSKRPYEYNIARLKKIRVGFSLLKKGKADGIFFSTFRISSKITRENRSL